MLKKKLLFLLLLVGTLVAVVQTYFAVQLFKKDKVAYIYNAQSMIVGNIKSLIEQELSKMTADTQFMFNQYQPHPDKLPEIANNLPISKSFQT